MLRVIYRTRAALNWGALVSSDLRGGVELIHIRMGLDLAGFPRAASYPAVY